MPDESPWITADEMLAETPEEPDYIVEQLLIRGAITELSAKIKAGKTTFMGLLLRSIFGLEPFMEFQTSQAEVLYLTEEGPQTFSSMLMRNRVTNSAGHLHVLMRGKVPRPILNKWPEIVEKLVVPKASEVKADVIVVDTMSKWAGIKGDDENSTGAANLAMEPLEVLRDTGLAVLTVHHDRKSGGSVGDSSRGSSAWGGSGDILLQLHNPETNGHPNRRELRSLGRFDDPGFWVMDLIDRSYVLQSEGEFVERDVVRQKFLTAGYQFAVTETQLEMMLDTNRSTLRRVLGELLKEGLAVRSGSGKRGDPYAWKVSGHL